MVSSPRLLCAPNAYKGSLSAAVAARAMAVAATSCGAVAVEFPVADGGDGTFDVLLGAAGAGARMEKYAVAGPLGRKVDARLGWLDRGTALIEMADAAGLRLLTTGGLEPRRAGSFGVGELILHALDAGATEILIGVGGSASTDGGGGILRALGARLVDAAGQDIAPGGEGLLDLVRIDATQVDARLAGCRVRVITDVNNPLHGESGAAAIYGPQKGATAADVELLNRGLRQFAAVAAATFPSCDPQQSGAGAAGGAAFGLTLLGAQITPGAKFICDYLGFDQRLQETDLVITGEGRFDAQSLNGKAPGEVLRRAHQAGIPCAVIAGSIEGNFPEIRFTLQLSDYPEDLQGNSAAAISRATQDLMAKAYP